MKYDLRLYRTTLRAEYCKYINQLYSIGEADAINNVPIRYIFRFFGSGASVCKHAPLPCNVTGDEHRQEGERLGRSGADRTCLIATVAPCATLAGALGSACSLISGVDGAARCEGAGGARRVAMSVPLLGARA